LVFWLSIISAQKAQQQRCALAETLWNTHDLTSDRCFWLVDHNNSSSWFAVSSSPLPYYLLRTLGRRAMLFLVLNPPSNSPKTWIK
jgi:hypothetical protein